LSNTNFIQDKSKNNNPKDNNNKNLNTYLNEKYNIIDADCYKMIQEFRVYALNATLMNWHEDIRFFKNNLHKLINIGEYVDL